MDNPTKHQALEALRARAFTTDEGRSIIHTYAGGFGADWDLEGAEHFIENATRIVWSPHLIGHDLLVSCEGRIVRFDVPMPAEAEAPNERRSPTGPP